MATAHESAHTAAGRAPGELDVELLGRRGCHLCDEAKAALGRIAQAVPLRLHETDVDGDFALRERYGLLVPVVLVDGERVSELRLDEGAVRERLGALWRAAQGRADDLHAARPPAGPRRTGAV